MMTCAPLYHNANSLLLIDPCSATAPIRHHLAAKEDGPASIRRLPMCQLRQGPRGASVPHRGTENCQEGVERVEGEEALK